MKILLGIVLIIFIAVPFAVQAEDVCPEQQKILPLSSKDIFKDIQEIELIDLKGICALDFVENGKYLLVTDGNKAIVIDASTLMKIKEIQIKDDTGNSLSSYWSSTNFVVSPDEKHILILDKYIDVKSDVVVSTLALEKILEKGQPNPEPLDISADGKMALVLVHSFYDAQYDSLALFDLVTGELIKVIKQNREIQNAIFYSSKRIIVFYGNGRIAIENLDGKEIIRLTDDGPVINVKGKKLSSVFVNDHNYFLASGATRDIINKLYTFNLSENVIISKDDCEGNITLTPDKRYVVYQATRLSDKLCPCGRHKLIDILLKVKNIQDGKVVKEIMFPQIFDIILLSKQSNNVLCCISHNKISKIELQYLPEH
jgi:hypothetical protein